MSDEKETPEVGVNSAKLPWPQDPQGFLGELKRGGVNAARRVKGNEEKLDKLMQSLRIIAQHAKARFDFDVAERGKARENFVSAKARIAERQRRAAEEHAVELEKAAARVRDQAGIGK